MQERRIRDALRALMNEKNLAVECARSSHDGVLLFSMFRIGRIDTLKDMVVRKICGVKKSLEGCVYESLSRWYGCKGYMVVPYIIVM